jgi:cellulose synthase/poly-beta-1,6-N-acetylglucosamine synthase-like glycosyltransferase
MKIVFTFAGIVFWTSLAFIVYTYVIYPVLLLALFAVSQIRKDLRYLFNRKDRRISRSISDDAIGVTLVIPAHNERAHIAEKIENIAALDYPRQRLQVVIVSDGSRDGTNDILAAVMDPCVEVVFLSERGGKANALNCAVQRAKHEVLVFSDASTMFERDTVKKLARHFNDATVGAVCGALRFHSNEDSRQTEGVYWSYESALRLMEGRLGAALNASGAVYALRRNAYAPLPSGAVLDDFLAPMNARNLGYRIVYDPEAIAADFAPESVKGEFARRVRIAAGSFQALPVLMRVRLDGVTLFSFISHKLLRWSVPFFLITALISNALLIGRPVYAIFAAIQLAFYIWALLGLTCHTYLKRIRFGLIGYFLLAMNVAFLVGFFRFLRNRQAIEWQRVN